MEELTRRSHTQLFLLTGDKLKIFAASDIHGDTELVKKLSEKAKGSDVIIIAGDITFAEESLEGLIGPFKKSAEKIMIIPGNF